MGTAGRTTGFKCGLEINGRCGVQGFIGRLLLAKGVEVSPLILGRHSGAAVGCCRVPLVRGE